MANVSNLVIRHQTDSNGTYFATWNFNGKTTTSTSNSGAIKVGSLVSIKAGSRYYNGVAIPSWVMNQKWYVYQLKGDRAVINKNEAGNNSIMSPINVNNLIGSGGSTTTTVSTDTLDHYTVKWYYDTGDGVWFSGGSSDVTDNNATYSGPSNAIKIKVSVTPVSKTYTVNGNTTSYWTGTAVSAEYSVEADPPEKSPTPSVKIEEFTLTATVDNVSDPRTDEIQFEIYNDVTRVNSGTVTVETCKASFSCTVSVGGKYRVRCRSVNINGDSRIYGAWTDFTSELTTIPAGVQNVVCSADSETSVKVDWDDETTAKSYKIEYTTNINYFDSSSSVSSVTVTNSLAYITGLETGKEWFFRVCAVNDNGDSIWSETVSIVIGSTPSSPTTWSSTTTVIVGEDLNLYWVHNCEDNSSQTYAELELTVGEETQTYTIRNSTSEDEKDKTSQYSIDTSKYTEGTTILWRVRTAGATKVYGKWSIQRTVEVYARPTLELKITDINGSSIDTVFSFPFYISGLAGPKTQAPIGYHLLITADTGYETLDQIGNTVLVSPGDTIYSQYFDTFEALLVELTASSIDLQNDTYYTATCTVSMNSGLTAEASLNFNVSWDDEIYEPDVEISIDKSTYAAYLRPYCVDNNGELISDVMLSVYRREFDGSFMKIVENIDNETNIYVSDPHPSLNYARYRIVAISKSTGAVSFYDTPPYPVNCFATIIQWDEEWKNLDTVNADIQEQPLWSGSLLELPYNIEISDKNNPDVELVEYIGREHPVSYYGTQVGYTSSWSMEIVKEDSETLYALRRLQRWMGDVYVREPSGSGYWANIKVSFSQKYNTLTIPVSFDVTRVAGGM